MAQPTPPTETSVLNKMIPLRDYFDKCLQLMQAQADERDKGYCDRFIALEKLTSERDTASNKAVQVAMMAADKAFDKASQAVEKRLEAANEWRDAMNDREQRFVPQSEVNIKFESMSERINAIEKQTVLSAGERKGISAVGATVFAAVSSLAAVVAIIVAIIAVFNRGPTTSPQVIYAPAPAVATPLPK